MGRILTLRCVSLGGATWQELDGGNVPELGRGILKGSTVAGYSPWKDMRVGWEDTSSMPACYYEWGLICNNSDGL